MRLIIVSGRSGSGKTISLNVLEDHGYYCVDNLPVDMLITLVSKLQDDHPYLAVSVDARNLPRDVNQLNDVLATLREQKDQVDIIYVDASQQTLLKRFSETRRKHPLTSETITLQEAIQQEHQLLSPIATMADLTIDTSQLSQHELASIIRERVATNKDGKMQLQIQSFGYKYGMLPDADFIFDVRCLPNPYWQNELRNKTGLDKDVANFLKSHSEVQLMVEDILRFLDNWIPQFEGNNRSYLTVGIGCTGGCHRSVYVAQAIGTQAKRLSLQVQIRHRDISTPI